MQDGCRASINGSKTIRALPRQKQPLPHANLRAPGPRQERERERDCARARFLEKESEEHLDGEGVGAESGLSQPVIQRCQFIDHLLQIVRLHLHATTTRVMP
jgi:hypothetical protein